MRLTYTSPMRWKRYGFLPPKIATQDVEQAFTLDADTDETDGIEAFRKASQSYRAHVRTHRREQ